MNVPRELRYTKTHEWVRIELLDVPYARFLPDILHELEEDDEEEEGDAINPSHYKVKGLPEAIDIMNHLMTPEQFEGYLWGNIVKYAYRYGRKGDKAETAGKIAWYANQLKAAEEWRKEHK